MWKLFKKELSLCLHPAAILFIFLGAFVVIPNYPYEVMFFFSGLGAFFICLTARENGDLAFTCALPVEKKRIAYARILLCVALQGAQALFALACTLVKAPLFQMPNYAGMDANLALFGLGALMLGTFNLIFFPLYFSNPNKVGKPFLIASVALFLLVTLDVICCYVCPFWAKLDTPDPAYLVRKLAFFFAALALYCGFTLGSFLISGRRFSQFDL